MKIKTLLLILGMSIGLSACSLTPKSPPTNTPKQENSTMETKDPQLSPTPTLTKDNSIDSIEADLKSTTILEEDFSDIK